MSWLTTPLAKWLQTIFISWSNQLAYPLNLFLLVVGPMLVFFFVRYSLWTAVFSLEGVTVVQGYSLQQMLSYQAWVLVIGLVAQGHSGMQISEDIRLGRISAFLIYPFQFWQFHAANFLAFQALQTVIAMLTIAGLHVAGLLPQLAWSTVGIGLAFAWLVGLVWFAVQFILGLLSFWLEETWQLRVIFALVASFLSGAAIPLEFFPAWLRSWLDYSPFPYLTWVPVRIFMDDYAGSVTLAASYLGGWLVLFAVTAAFVWRRGLRLYTAAGM